MKINNVFDKKDWRRGFDRTEKGWRAVVAWIKEQDNVKEEGKNHISEDHRGVNNKGNRLKEDRKGKGQETAVWHKWRRGI